MSSTNQPILNFVESDSAVQLPGVYEADDPDLAQFASIILNVRTSECAVLSKTAIIDNAPAGIFHFEFLPADLPVGRHQADIVFTDLSGDEETFPEERPLLLVVRSRV